MENKKNTGYPSMDKPWEKYYIEEEYKKERPKRTVYQEVYENNKDYPNDLAIEFFENKINFSEFAKRVNAVAKAFEEYGIKKGDFVTICVTGIPETAYSFYALSKIGAVANMIPPYFDKKFFVKKVNECESKIIIVMDKFYEKIKETIKQTNVENIVVLPAMNSSFIRHFSKAYKLEKHSRELFWNQFIKDGKKQAEKSSIPYEKDTPVALVYSSGTTGNPKGVLLSNDSFQNSIQAYPASGVNITRGQKFYQVIPLWFSTGISTSLHLPLSYGTAVLMDPRYDSEVFIKKTLKCKPNYTVAPFAHYKGFLVPEWVKNKDLSFFTDPFQGGEGSEEKLVEEIENVFEKHGSKAKIRMAYGQTEACAAITTETQNLKHVKGSVGIPLPKVNIAIMDDDLNELKYNHRGEIVACMESRMIGYHNNPEATAEYFYYDDLGQKWSKTNDIGHVNEDGFLFVHGRKDDVSDLNGVRFFNFDVEKIVNANKYVKTSDVFSIGESGSEELVAHIILTEEGESAIKNGIIDVEEMLISISEKILEVTGEKNMIPTKYKIRKDFPLAISRKKDNESLRNEREGFISLPSSEKRLVLK